MKIRSERRFELLHLRTRAERAVKEKSFKKHMVGLKELQGELKLLKREISSFSDAEAKISKKASCKPQNLHSFQKLLIKAKSGLSDSFKTKSSAEDSLKMEASELLENICGIKIKEDCIAKKVSFIKAEQNEKLQEILDGDLQELVILKDEAIPNIALAHKEANLKVNGIPGIGDSPGNQLQAISKGDPLNGKATANRELHDSGNATERFSFEIKQEKGGELKVDLQHVDGLLDVSISSQANNSSSALLRQQGSLREQLEKSGYTVRDFNIRKDREKNNQHNRRSNG